MLFCPKHGCRGLLHAKRPGDLIVPRRSRPSPISPSQISPLADLAPRCPPGSQNSRQPPPFKLLTVSAENQSWALIDRGRYFQGVRVSGRVRASINHAVPSGTFRRHLSAPEIAHRRGERAGELTRCYGSE